MNPTYRIISGQWKAKRISAPKHFIVRPTTDFAKEALFSILDNRYALASSSVLDLFSGIGSITLEFASRGCQDIQSVEMNAKHAGFIQHTASELDLVLNMNIQRADVFDWLKKNKGKKQYDIIFADPPFDLDEKKYQELIALVLENDYLKENGVFILEHSSRMKLEHSQLLESRKYGNISFAFFNKETEVPL
ncbi:RsmD family RNA methyltransferase [Bergeyella zoohelcum]|uniref:RsmD family RNA methyltransferase n=1 Tax=Bergeyella zoohelcum ATCC 43767 TaxID=883096 RepID=K1LCE3_9FLAO|nr:RsmD family RNA methyltransferase [Bergeyella zoohelcum]EKB54240.1 RsmD family RNA methyltransferase [Bergeyella zoohelcum ATCC 43767]SUV49872.1 Ribosomal RNA small subunit methyltransferase D [Bergeyella zoohelcum]